MVGSFFIFEAWVASGRKSATAAVMTRASAPRTWARVASRICWALPTRVTSTEEGRNAITESSMLAAMTRTRAPARAAAAAMARP